MKDSIIVSVTELRSLLQDIRRDGMDYVRVSIIPEDDFVKEEIVPASLLLSACKHYETSDWTDYQEIYALDNSESLEDEYQKEENSTEFFF